MNHSHAFLDDPVVHPDSWRWAWSPDPGASWKQDVLVIPLPGSKERHAHELRFLDIELTRALNRIRARVRRRLQAHALSN